MIAIRAFGMAQLTYIIVVLLELIKTAGSSTARSLLDLLFII